MNLSWPDIFPQANPFPLTGKPGRFIGSWARKAGREAKRLVSSPPLSGKVFAHFSGSLYLMTDQEDLFWIRVEPFPMHRRCLLVSSLPLPHPVRAGERFQIQDSALGIGNFFSIDLSSHTEWAPAPIFKKNPHPFAELWPRYERLNNYLNCLASPRGLGQVIPLVFALAEEGEIPSLSSISIARQMLNPVLAIAKACRQRDLEAVLLEGENLAGLGPGLTPSGDDFLGGLLFMIHSLNSAYPVIFPWNQERILGFVARAKSQTHPLSHAILSDFASGHAPAPLHELVTALIYGSDFGEALSALLLCLKFGHSSGWDVLSGLLTGMLMMPKNPINN